MDIIITQVNVIILYLIIMNVRLMLQNKLRVLLEKSMITSKIVIITQKYNNVIDALKNGFLKHQESLYIKIMKFLYFKNLFIKHMFIIDDDILMDIIKKHSDINYNFINILGFSKLKRYLIFMMK